MHDENDEREEAESDIEITASTGLYAPKAFSTAWVDLSRPHAAEAALYAAIAIANPLVVLLGWREVPLG